MVGESVILVSVSTSDPIPYLALLSAAVCMCNVHCAGLQFLFVSCINCHSMHTSYVLYSDVSVC